MKKQFSVKMLRRRSLTVDVPESGIAIGVEHLSNVLVGEGAPCGERLGVGEAVTAVAIVRHLHQITLQQARHVRSREQKKIKKNRR